MNNGNGSPITTISKRKRSNFSDTIRDRKMQRISSNLANDIARHLSMTDHENNRPNIIGISDDVDMDTTNNNNNNNSINKPIPSRVYKRPVRKSNFTQTTTNVLGHRFSNNIDTTTTCTDNDQQGGHPILKRISAGNLNQPISSTKMGIDFDQWLKQQAQRQNLNILDYRQVFNEKQNQLQHCLQQIDSTDYTKTNDERFQTIKENLERILKIVHELSGDHSLAFTVSVPFFFVSKGKKKKRIKQNFIYCRLC